MNLSDFERNISASLLRLRMKSPFFATLALFASIQSTPHTPTAATDGQDIFINPDFGRSLSSPQLDGLLLHEVLHAALLHVVRRGTREPRLWNVAADIVVNGLIAREPGFELPHGGVRDSALEHLSVEEIYDLLLTQNDQRSCPPDLVDGSLDRERDDAGSSLDQERSPISTNLDSKQGKSSEGTPATDSLSIDSLSEARKKALEAHWRNAMNQAIAITHSSTTQGTLPAGLNRELAAVMQSQLDWRSHLWRYLVRTPTDFSGFDRRFIGQRLYLETLEGETVYVYVAIDTSGSIGDRDLQLFLGEMQGILSAYPHLQCELYYADADVYGPYEIQIGDTIPHPIGGGGTSFVPFFNRVGDRCNWFQTGICVYLTDGYGTFPEQPPALPTLWVVTPGGLDLDQFPFGEAVRLLNSKTSSPDRSLMQAS